MAIASVIINTYKRRSVLTAYNADVPPTTVGVAYLRFMNNVKTDTCALYTHQRHICACNRNLVVHKSLFSRRPNRNFVECDPGPHATLTYRIRVLTVVRKRGSGYGKNDFSAFH